MLDFQVRDGVAWLTLQRPEVLNAINRAMANALRLRLEELQRRPDVRVVVTRGAGRAFCAGSDLRELAPLPAPEAAQYELEFAQIFAKLDQLPQPTIAVLHGHALGGGLGLALYHDFRIASATASLGMPEVELGWIPPWAVGRMIEVVGFAQARWLLLSSKVLSGADALALGLVNEALPENQLAPEVEKLASKLAAMPPEGVRKTKMFLNQMSPLRSLKHDETAAEEFRDCFSKPEAQQRIKDFLERRIKR
jgi:enoyl-CoA hydratase/carnithine racemase